MPVGAAAVRLRARLRPITIAEVVMGNVFVHTMMSLDGFIAGPTTT
jgi:hypothetical protein